MQTKKRKITPKKLKTLQTQLKNLNIKWVNLLVEQMQNDDKLYKEYGAIDGRKVYNVFNGVVKDGGWKLLMYKQGTKLKKKLETAMSKAVA
jgi:hypothetical protein